MTRVALCFPGQGSQAAGMASGLRDSPLAASLLAAAEEHGLDLGAALESDEERLRGTEIAQPALVFTELVLAAELPEHLDLVGVAGHSVGEYAALSVAGAMAPEVALGLVVERGRAMAAMRDGTMAAVLGLDAAAVEEACRAVAATGEVAVVANYNAPGQLVISGSVAGVEHAAEACRASGARRVLPLKVGGAFHSPLMREAAAAFAPVIDAAAMGAMRCPVVVNVDAEAVDDAQALPAKLRAQMESPVRWVACIERLRAMGAELLVEVGPGSVLTGLAKRIAPELRTASVATPAAARDLLTQVAVA